MKKLILATTFALLPMIALAAPTGYKDARDCQVPPDHGVYGGPEGQLSGCITAEAWDAAQKVSLNQANLQPFIRALPSSAATVWPTPARGGSSCSTASCLTERDSAAGRQFYRLTYNEYDL
jgi:hypothetical protein